MSCTLSPIFGHTSSTRDRAGSWTITCKCETTRLSNTSVLDLGGPGASSPAPNLSRPRAWSISTRSDQPLPANSEFSGERGVSNRRCHATTGTPTTRRGPARDSGSATCEEKEAHAIRRIRYTKKMDRMDPHLQIGRLIILLR